MNYMLDTDKASYASKAAHARVDAELVRFEGRLCVSAITRCEML